MKPATIVGVMAVGIMVIIGLALTMGAKF